MSKQEILAMNDRSAAFAHIQELDLSSRKKAIIRLLWKKRHEPDTIKKNPKKGKRKDHSLQIDRLQKKISELQTKLKELIKTSATKEDECPICHKDPEGYDLPCNHCICHDCFQERLDDGKIKCSVCLKIFEFDM